MLFHLYGKSNSSENEELTDPIKDLSVESLSSLPAEIQKVITSQFKGFTDQALQALVDYDNVARKLSYSFGGSRAFAEEIRNSMVLAEVAVKGMGGSFADLLDIQKGVNESMGEMSILTTETYADLYATVNMTNDGLGVTQQGVTKLVDVFTQAGFNVKNIGYETTKIFNVAREAGVNAQKVFDQVESNLSKINLFNFQNGVEGMAKMAAHATSMKIKMDDTLKIADQLFNPEKAVQMAADFQRLGVSVTSLLNPYELQDMARNDPQKLQEALGEAMSQLTYFNESTQKMELYDYAKPLIRQISESTGMSLDYLMNVGLQTGELKKKMSEIVFPDFAKDEKSRQMIAQLASIGRMGGKYEGQYVVTIDGMEKALDELSEQDWKSLEAKMAEQEKPAKDMVQLQTESNGHLLTLINEVKSLQGILPRRLGSSAKVTNIVQKGAQLGREMLTTGAAAIGIENREFTQGGGTYYDPSKMFQKIEDPNTWKPLEAAITNSAAQLATAMSTGTVDAKLLKSISDQFENAFKESFEKAFPDAKNFYDKFSEGFMKILTQVQTGSFSLSSIPGISSLIPSSSSVPSTSTSAPPANVNYSTYVQTLANTSVGKVLVSADPNNPLSLSIKMDPAELANYITKTEILSQPFMDKIVDGAKEIIAQRAITFGLLNQ
jgi:hypothetical protein